MGKLLRTLFTALVAILAVVVAASAVQAYPGPSEPEFQLTGNGVQSKIVVVAGHTFTGEASASVQCTPWRLRFLNQSATAVGKSISKTFRAPVVRKRTTFQMRASCTYATAGDASARGAADAGKRTWTGDLPVTVVPAKSGSSGSAAGAGTGQGGTDQAGAGVLGLPGTGGPSLWIGLGALAALFLGAGTMLRSRRRDSGSL